MQSFPMFIKTSNRRFVIVGGGEQAAQKCRLLLKTDVQIDILCDRLDDELQSLAAKGRIHKKTGSISPKSFKNATLVFIATGCPAFDRCIHSLAKEARALVNVVDQPDLCDVTTPSIVDRDPVVVAIGTEGTAPVLARRLKTRIEQMLDPNIGRFAASVGPLRTMVTRNLPKERRRHFWKQVFTDRIWNLYKVGAERQAMAELKLMITNATQNLPVGTISIIDTSAGAADLLSLRAVERLQDADEIFYETTCDESVLELARRDAERHMLASCSGSNPWPKLMCVSFVKRAASKGRKIVWLTKRLELGSKGDQLIQSSLSDFDIEVLAATPSSTLRKQAFLTHNIQ